ILPFFSGERSPGYDDMARAAIMGVCRSTTRAELLRAGLESVCLRLATIHLLFLMLLMPAVVASGAALSASPVWRQMLADVLGMRVLSSEVTEETQLGVAMVLSAALEEM
ncbi:unnamed protein product, partial [Discosporangium mesarthrocarpum]